MDIFSQIDCMVADGVLTEAQADQYRAVMKDLTGLQEEDLLMIIAATTGGGGGGGGQAPTFPTGDTIAEAGNIFLTDTSGGSFTITLPAAPVLGDKIDIYDAQSNWAVNNLTVNGNGNLIDGNNGDLICNLSNAHLQLVFTGSPQVWSVFNL